MRAAWYNHFGKANEVLQIGDLEKPEPLRGQVHCPAAGNRGINRHIIFNPRDREVIRMPPWGAVINPGPVVRDFYI